MSLIDNELNPEEEVSKAETKRDELRVDERTMKDTEMRHKPDCATHMHCAVFHADGICPGYKSCDCGVESPKEVGELEKDWEKRFDECARGIILLERADEWTNETGRDVTLGDLHEMTRPIYGFIRKTRKEAHEQGRLDEREETMKILKVAREQSKVIGRLAGLDEAIGAISDWDNGQTVITSIDTGEPTLNWILEQLEALKESQRTNYYEGDYTNPLTGEALKESQTKEIKE